MKMNKKKLLSLALVIVLIAILSFGTLAWFSDADEVTNTFMVTNSLAEPNKIFSVDLKEKVDTNGDGKYDETEDGVQENGHTYTDILPGASLYKEPVVKNSGSYDQYIRVKVTATDAREWQAMLAGHNISDLTELFGGYDDAKWIRIDEPDWDQDQDTVTYTFYLQRILEPGKQESLFTHVNIPGQLTQNDLATVGGDFQLKIVAEAVQTENLGDNVDTAKEAFAVLDASGQKIDQIQ